MDVRCLWCGESLEDGREETGFTGEGPDWGSAPGEPGEPWLSVKSRAYGTYLDYGCDSSPATGEDGTGSHTPNMIVTWDGYVLVLDPDTLDLDAALEQRIELTDDDWTTTLPVPAGLLPTPTQK